MSLKILDVFITELCNLSCSYCTATNDIESFIPIEELKNIDYSNYTTINILGGEPLLHPDILDILEYYNTLNKTIILYTNGILISELDLKSYNFKNINIHITFHTFGEEVQGVMDYMESNKFYKDIRYQMIYTGANVSKLKEFNNTEISAKIFLGYDVYLDLDFKLYIDIRRTLDNFKLTLIDLLFKKDEKDIIRTTDVILKSNTDIITEHNEGFNYCLLKYHFEWGNNAE